MGLHYLLYANNGFEGFHAMPARPSGSGDKIKVKFTLQQATKAQRGIRGIALLFL
jgi:hypothetical protein